jgi:nucleoid-associated protein YgaU
MGLFSFLKDTGAKLFHGGDANANDPAKIAEAKNQKVQVLGQVISSLGLRIDNCTLDLNDAGDVVTIHGDAMNQAEREKIILALGNSEGISGVDDQMTVQVVEAPATFYTVKKGDSLSKISKEFYGDYMRYPEIFEANKPMLAEVDLIYPGQVLRIPGV